MVLMIPRRGQGFAGEVSGSLGQLVEGSLQVVEFPPLAPCPPMLEFQVFPFDGLQGVDE